MCFQRSQVFRQDSPLPPRWPVGNRRQQLLRDIVTEERHGPQLQHGGAPCLEAFRTAAMWHCEPPKPSGLEESFEKSPTLTAAQLPLQIHPEVRYSVILHHPQTSHPTEGRSVTARLPSAPLWRHFPLSAAHAPCERPPPPPAALPLTFLSRSVRTLLFPPLSKLRRFSSARRSITRSSLSRRVSGSELGVPHPLRDTYSPCPVAE